MSKIEIAKPFIDASNDMLSLELGLDVNKGPVSETSKQGTSQEVNILIGVTGDITGTVIYGMSVETAKAIAGTMLMHEVSSLERNAQSALCELGNMTSGMATSRLDPSISNVALTPPSIVVGKDIFISVLKLGCIQIQLITEVGAIDITVALEERIIKAEAQAC
ncbi:MAG: chemotaxis protein CheX [Rubrobacteridae bacterium]|nr:chemotaxis protein CheX [Rubrobacteridae bacterium]